MSQDPFSRAKRPLCCTESGLMRVRNHILSTFDTWQLLFLAVWELLIAVYCKLQVLIAKPDYNFYFLITLLVNYLQFYFFKSWKQLQILKFHI